MDGTKNKEEPGGGNGILSVSLACAKAGAETENYQFTDIHQYIHIQY